MVFPADLADKLIKIELSLKAYQKLHEDELAELWRALDACKKSLAQNNTAGDLPDSLAPPSATSKGSS